jgi:hypothetical protein
MALAVAPPRAPPGASVLPPPSAPVPEWPPAWSRPGAVVGAAFNASRALVYVHVPKTAGTFMLVAVRKIARGRRLAFVHLANASAGYAVRACACSRRAPSRACTRFRACLRLVGVVMIYLRSRAVP